MGFSAFWAARFGTWLFYWLTPRLWDKPLHSKKAADAHFWLATIGIATYMISMWISGLNQGLMWRALNPDGTLVYTFVESVKATFPFYLIRLAGGLLYLAGMVVMSWNVVMTIKNGAARPAPIPQLAHA